MYMTPFPGMYLNNKTINLNHKTERTYCVTYGCVTCINVTCVLTYDV